MSKAGFEDRKTWGRVRREWREVRREVRRVDRLEAFAITALDASVSKGLEGIKVKRLRGGSGGLAGCTDQ